MPSAGTPTASIRKACSATSHRYRALLPDSLRIAYLPSSVRTLQRGKSSIMRLIGHFRDRLLGDRGSWSQFGEDAYLRSYLRSLNWTPRGGFSPIERGFYVDVGCYHPVSLSNTRWLYLQGWRGINIDPSPGVKACFDRWRPRDINLQLAIANDAGTVTFWTDSGDSSVFNTTSETYAREMLARGVVRDLVPITVPCAKLSSVLESYVPNGIPVDLMTVDAEGNDLRVLQSNDWRRFRPRILLVEAHANGISELCDSEAVGFMRMQGYEVHAWLRPTAMLVPREAAGVRPIA